MDSAPHGTVQTKPTAAQGAPLVPVAESPSGILLLTLTAAALVLLAGRFSRLLSRLAVRLGLDAERSFSRLGRGLQWLIVLVVLGIVSRRLFWALPGWTTPALALVAVALWLLTTGTVSDVFGGLSAQFRIGLRVGDHIEIGGLSGQVREIHLARVQLRGAGGHYVSVPGRRFLAEAVTMSPLRGAEPLSVSVALPRPLGEPQLSTLRERLLFMPYRIPGSPLSVSRDGACLTVHCALWQQGAVGPAEDFVRAACAEAAEGVEDARTDG